MSNKIGRRMRIVAEVPWPAWHTMPLPAEFKPDRIVWEYLGCTYGCMSGDEIPVSLKPGVAPFYGVPQDALEDAPVEGDPLLAGIRERAKQSALRMIGEPYTARLRAAVEGPGMPERSFPRLHATRTVPPRTDPVTGMPSAPEVPAGTVLYAHAGPADVEPGHVAVSFEPGGPWFGVAKDAVEVA